MPGGDLLSELVDKVIDAIDKRWSEINQPTEYMRFPAAAKYMNETVPSLRALIRKGKIPVRYSNQQQQWIAKKDIDAYMESIKRFSPAAKVVPKQIKPSGE